MIDTAIKNIEGDISLDEAQELFNTYIEEEGWRKYCDKKEVEERSAVIDDEIVWHGSMVQWCRYHSEKDTVCFG